MFSTNPDALGLGAAIEPHIVFQCFALQITARQHSLLSGLAKGALELVEGPAGERCELPLRKPRLMSGSFCPPPPKARH